MEYSGILITGTSGAGKSTVSRKLCEQYALFEIVPAVTTRKPRADDSISQYRYVGQEEFEDSARKGELLIASEYRGERYGISVSAFQNVVGNGKIPLFVVTPTSVEPLGLELNRSEHAK